MVTDDQNGTPVIEVCYGPECSDRGGRELADELKALGHECVMGDCRNQCPHAPLVLVDGWMITRTTLPKVLDRIKATRA